MPHRHVISLQHQYVANSSHSGGWMKTSQKDWGSCFMSRLTHLQLPQSRSQLQNPSTKGSHHHEINGRKWYNVWLWFVLHKHSDSRSRQQVWLHSHYLSHQRGRQDDSIIMSEHTNCKITLMGSAVVKSMLKAIYFHSIFFQMSLVNALNYLLISFNEENFHLCYCCSAAEICCLQSLRQSQRGSYRSSAVCFFSS